MKRVSGSGFSIIELLVVSGILSVVLLSMSTLSNILLKQQGQSNLTFQADMARRSLVALLSGPASWANTIAASKNNRGNGPALDCLNPTAPTPCTDSGQDYNPAGGGGNPLTNVPIYVILDGSPTVKADGEKGNVFYTPGLPTDGFTSQGTVCHTFDRDPARGDDACPLRFDITWSAICTNTCVNPQIKFSVQAVYNPKTKTDMKVFNVANYSSLNVFRDSSGGSADPPRGTWCGLNVTSGNSGGVMYRWAVLAPHSGPDCKGKLPPDDCPPGYSGAWFCFINNPTGGQQCIGFGTCIKD